MFTIFAGKKQKQHMEKKDIKDLDCSKMVINPLHPKIVNFIEDNIPSIKEANVEYKSKVFTKTMVYRYILLQYDPNSEIQKMQSLDWFKKKAESCEYAGFKLKKGRDAHERFDERVLDMVLGKNSVINDIIVEFLSWMNNATWEYVVFLKEAMNSMTRDSVGGASMKARMSQDYIKLFNDYKKASHQLAHVFEETEEFVSSFYWKIEQSRLAITCEDYAAALSKDTDLASDSPYGINYKVDSVRFLGDKEPNV